MGTSIGRRARATDVRFTREAMVVALADGRVISTPLSWFPRLRAATRKDLRAYRLIGRGVGIHWEALDEDLSVDGLLAPSPRARRAPDRPSPAPR